eukprot:CAMPEP_0198604118 /NCGR_PEP_ID=MMETSP1462-20131121/152780_1 /TAXON_ID=1333877 /ORGANISM="Brandtodinium nutriculum, Strain RCC3387" /LENGTH=142 /DNA_ID=CAMNT_0044335899 /DNA_START=130 /DNA_END=555 /DNA_ORIENTATION=-
MILQALPLLRPRVRGKSGKSEGFPERNGTTIHLHRTTQFSNFVRRHHRGGNWRISSRSVGRKIAQRELQHRQCQHVEARAILDAALSQGQAGLQRRVAHQQVPHSHAAQGFHSHRDVPDELGGVCFHLADHPAAEQNSGDPD